VSIWNSDIQAAFTGGGLQLVMLDLDGTLIDSVPDLHQAVNIMLTALQREPVSALQVSHWVGNGLNMLLRRALALGNEEQALTLDDEFLQLAHQHFDPAYEATVHNATGVYPCVEEWFAATEGHIKRVLVTNKSRRFTEPLIASLGWQQHFSLLMCGDDLAEKKPSPMPLLYACEQLKIAVENTLMIGDSRTDIRAAKAAAIACAAVTYGYNHGESVALSEPDWMVDNLLQLLTAE